MIRRFAITLGVPVVALVTALTAAAPASAAVGGGCSGPSCSVNLGQFIDLTGSGKGPGTGYIPMSVDPPPCLWNPIGDAVSGSNAIISEWGPSPPTQFQIDQSYAQAQKLVKNPAPGTWYELPINPAASAAAQAECLKLPLYAFVPPGQSPPTPPIPGKILAEYAFNNLKVWAPALQINPAGKGYVNLATYVWNTRPVRPLWVRATLRGNAGEWAQVTVTPGKLTISTTGPGTPYSKCGAGGSRFRPIGTVPASASGPGTPPDCGVLWTGPASGAVITATIVWHVTFSSYDGTAPAPTTIPMSASFTPIPVNEIQSVNGG